MDEIGEKITSGTAKTPPDLDHMFWRNELFSIWKLEKVCIYIYIYRVAHKKSTFQIFVNNF